MEDFRSRILCFIRDVMTKEEQYEESMTSWNGPQTKGFEIVFKSVKRGVPVMSGVVAQIFITSDGGFEVFVNTYLVKDNLRSLVKSFSLPDSSSLPTEISNGMLPLVMSVTESVTLSHLLMIHQIRDRILKNLNTSSTTRLCSTSRAIRAALTSRNVDETYWRRLLKKKFGNEKVQYAMSNGRKFWALFFELMNENSRTQISNEELSRPRHTNPLLVDTFAPRNPTIHSDIEPMLGEYDPLNPIRNPRIPPGGGPQNPLGPLGNPLGGRRGNADLDPFGDPMLRGIFGPPRGDGRGLGGGNPFMRGGGGGFI